MEGWGAMAAGIICGLAGSAPQAYLFEAAHRGRGTVSVGLGLASVAISFISLTLVLLAVWLIVPEQELTFGVSMIVGYLALWGIEAVRAWRAAKAQ